MGAQPDEDLNVAGVHFWPVPACHGIHMSDAYTFGRELSGGLVRFLPYPVMGGFLAGTGWLLTTGGIGMMVNPSISPGLFLPPMLLRWLPGLILGAVMLLAVNRLKGPLVLPGIFAGAVVLFYAIAWLTNTPKRPRFVSACRRMPSVPSSGKLGARDWRLANLRKRLSRQRPLSPSPPPPKHGC